MSQKVEYRSVAELRAAKSADNRPILEGHAAVFNSPTTIYDFVEVILPGAFSETIAKDTIVALRNHNSDQPLGRNTAGTLRLSEDSRGLAFSIDVPDVTYANDLVVSVERGDLAGNSFSFIVPPGGDDWRYNDQGVLVRTISRAQVFEVSAGVTFPAYLETDIAVKRSIDELREVVVEMRKKLGPASDPQTRGVETGNVALLKLKAQTLGL